MNSIGSASSHAGRVISITAVKYHDLGSRSARCREHRSVPGSAPTHVPEALTRRPTARDIGGFYGQQASVHTRPRCDAPPPLVNARRREAACAASQTLRPPGRFTMGTPIRCGFALLTLARGILDVSNQPEQALPPARHDTAKHADTEGICGVACRRSSPRSRVQTESSGRTIRVTPVGSPPTGGYTQWSTGCHTRLMVTIPRVTARSAIPAYQAVGTRFGRYPAARAIRCGQPAQINCAIGFTLATVHGMLLAWRAEGELVRSPGRARQ